MTAPLLRRTAPHLALAFAGMGTWALLANRGHPWPGMLLAGALQGTMSAGLTFAMKRLIEGIARAARGVAARLAPPLACGLLSATVLSTVHRLAGTPEVLATLAVPVTVATGYAALYASALTRGRGLRP